MESENAESTAASIARVPPQHSDRRRSASSAPEKQLGLEHGLRYFNEVGEGISQRFMGATRKWIPINRQNFTDSSMPEFLSMLRLPPTASIATMAAPLGGSDFDFGMGLFAVVRPGFGPAAELRTSSPA